MKTITLPAGTEYVRFEELAHLIAHSMHPPKYDCSPGDGMNYGYASVTLESELAQVAGTKDLPLKDPLTRGPYKYHGGTRPEDALVRVDDLRKYVADRGIGVEVEGRAQVVGDQVDAVELVLSDDAYSLEPKAPGLPMGSEPTVVQNFNISHHNFAVFGGLSGYGIQTSAQTLSQVPEGDSYSAGQAAPIAPLVNAPAQTETPAPKVPASDGLEQSKRTKRRTWRDVSEAYLERTFKELQCPTVKVFYRKLMNKAGPDTPFDKGTGQNVGSLFARDPGVTVTEKMIEGFVTELRKKM